MDKVIVYKVHFASIAAGVTGTAQRMATEAGAKEMGGEIVEGSGIEIDRSELEPGHEWTAIDFQAVGRNGIHRSGG